ncbi:hypothetical protein OHB25_03520 [Streptomyces mirabilis]|uniref:hypothetical protein n=1 Tax=Streptomyces mirabilis TaxID=68239 RepID=UPI002E1F660F
MTTLQGATAVKFVLAGCVFFAAASTVRWVMVVSPLGRAGHSRIFGSRPRR